MTLRRHHREGLTVGVFLDLDHPGDAREVSEDRVVRRYLQLRFRLPRHVRDGGRLLVHLAPVAPQEVLPEPPLVLCRCCHLASLPTIVVVHRLPNVTKSVTKLLSHNFLAFRLTFLLYDPTRRTQPQRGMRRLHGPSHHRDQLVAQTVQGRLVPKFGRESFDSVSRVIPPAVEAWFYEALDATAQRSEQRCYRHRRSHDHQLRVAPGSTERVLQGGHAAAEVHPCQGARERAVHQRAVAEDVYVVTPPDATLTPGRRESEVRIERDRCRRSYGGGARSVHR